MKHTRNRVLEKTFLTALLLFVAATTHLYAQGGTTYAACGGYGENAAADGGTLEHASGLTGFSGSFARADGSALGYESKIVLPSGFLEWALAPGTPAEDIKNESKKVSMYAKLADGAGKVLYEASFSKEESYVTIAGVKLTADMVNSASSEGFTTRPPITQAQMQAILDLRDSQTGAAARCMLTRLFNEEGSEMTSGLYLTAFLPLAMVIDDGSLDADAPSLWPFAQGTTEGLFFCNIWGDPHLYPQCLNPGNSVCNGCCGAGCGGCAALGGCCAVECQIHDDCADQYGLFHPLCDAIFIFAILAYIFKCIVPLILCIIQFILCVIFGIQIFCW